MSMKYYHDSVVHLNPKGHPGPTLSSQEVSLRLLVEDTPGNASWRAAANDTCIALQS